MNLKLAAFYDEDEIGERSRYSQGLNILEELLVSIDARVSCGTIPVVLLNGDDAIEAQNIVIDVTLQVVLVHELVLAAFSSARILELINPNADVLCGANLNLDMTMLSFIRGIHFDDEFHKFCTGSHIFSLVGMKLDETKRSNE